MEPKQSWILLDTNNILRKSCVNIELPINIEDQKYINKMISYIDSCLNDEENKFNIRPGVAVAGPQVGLLKRVIYINFINGDKKYKFLLANPKIVSKSIGMCYLESGEGCLSVVDNHLGIVPRHNKIEVSAYDLINKKNIKIVAEGILSICFQHEIDHLDGILFYDRINKNSPMFVQKEWIKI